MRVMKTSSNPGQKSTLGESFHISCAKRIPSILGAFSFQITCQQWIYSMVQEGDKVREQQRQTPFQPISLS
jgi:hypothetical protein